MSQKEGYINFEEYSRVGNLRKRKGLTRGALLSFFRRKMG